MKDSIKTVFELSPSPMLAIEGGKIIYANSRAAELFEVGASFCPAVGKVPDHVLANPSAEFVSTANIDGRRYCVSAARRDGVLYLSFNPESSGCGSEFLSDSLLNSMLSSLFTIGLSIDRITAETGPETDTKLSGYLSILNHNYFTLRRSISNLSTAIALKKNDLPFFFHTVDLARLCSNLVSTAAVMTGGKGISIGFSTPLGELYARADGEKIERILLNIISNSVAHTPAGGKITVGLEKSGDNAFISVTDTGCGIPAAEMAQLFTKFERDSISPSLSSLSTGGLGLGVARGLAEGHGGALIIESREGKGTCVRIMIPLRSSELTVLESPSSDYVNSGMSLILTELAPVLDAGSYESRFLD